MKNMQVLLASRPRGPVDESHFRIVESDVPNYGAMVGSSIMTMLCGFTKPTSTSMSLPDGLTTVMNFCS